MAIPVTVRRAAHEMLVMAAVKVYSRRKEQKRCRTKLSTVSIWAVWLVYLLPPAAGILHEPCVFAGQVCHQIPRRQTAVRVALPVETDRCATCTSLPDADIAEDPQTLGSFAQVTHFDPVVLLVLDEGVLGKADNVAPIKLIETGQEWVAGVDTISEQRDGTPRREQRLQPVQQRARLIGPGSVGVVDQKPER